MTAHQQLRQFAIALGNGVENTVMLGKGLMWPVRRGGKLNAVHAHQLVKLVAQQLGQSTIAAALDNPVVEVEVTFLLVIANSRLKCLVALVSTQYTTQLIDLAVAHALSSQPAGHAFQRLADLIELDQLSMTERNHAGADMGDAHQKFLAFEAMNSFTQWPTANAIGARQLWFGNLAARCDFATNDGRLDRAEHMLGQRTAVRMLYDCRDFHCIEHDCQHLSISLPPSYDAVAAQSNQPVGYCQQYD